MILQFLQVEYIKYDTVVLQQCNQSTSLDKPRSSRHRYAIKHNLKLIYRFLEYTYGKLIPYMVIFNMDAIAVVYWFVKMKHKTPFEIMGNPIFLTSLVV